MLFSNCQQAGNWYEWRFTFAGTVLVFESKEERRFQLEATLIRLHYLSSGKIFSDQCLSQPLQIVWIGETTEDNSCRRVNLFYWGVHCSADPELLLNIS